MSRPHARIDGVVDRRPIGVGVLVDVEVDELDHRLTRIGLWCVVHGSVQHDTADVFVITHVLVAPVDFVERVRLGDQFVKLEIAVLVHA